MSSENGWEPKAKDLVNEVLINAHSKSAFSSFSDVEKFILEFRDDMQSVIDVAASFLRLNAKEREFNREVIPEFGAKIISLGFDCLPRTVLTRWGIKPSKIDGELTYPFDLAVHPTGVVAKLLNTNFLNYLDKEAFDVVNGVPRNVTLNVDFNHETGKQFIENQFLLLRDRYSNRISNLKELSTYERCVFVHHINNEAMLENLIESVRRFRENNNDLLVVIKTDSDFKSIDSLDSQYGGLKVVYKYIPKPYEKYIWHQEAHYSSKEGIEFERKIANFTTQSIKQVFSRVV